MEQRLSIGAPTIHRHMKEAQRVSRRGREVCGLIVSADNYRLDLLPVKNVSKRLGSFEITPYWWRIARRSSGFHEREVVGTYHSHPVSSAEPGESAVENTWDGALMLIVVCNTWHKELRLWRIRNGLASAIPLATWFQPEQDATAV